ncbi:citrate lyase acyl carrier protein [Salmonella enterica subsp. enterica serovar Montevideo]|nr:citrate lyase acyl carrier protein [Salmonella enterica subsp. enterica serovar Montevideo]EIY7345510.1 citrate lyase acyl carrier protein [Salmonella enterica subsp. enterica serovar Montevideo]EKL7350424.1 citrate lyase acyl carrier protein [Salmonella enterica subsp. enterica serovar Montevideo]
MKIIKDALAGTLESSDVMIRIGPSSEPGIRLELESLVKQQFGAAIEQVVRETLAKLGVERALVSVDDKGALECILRARVQAAALRAAEQTEFNGVRYETTSQYVVYPRRKCGHVEHLVCLWCGRGDVRLRRRRSVT